MNLGVVDFEKTWLFQKHLQSERLQGKRHDTLMVVEHHPVFTLGRTTKSEHLYGNKDALQNQGHPVLAIERGGSVTFHGPGQIVAYPIFQLRNFCSGPKAYIQMVVEVMNRVLSQWDIRGRPLERFPGVWVEGSSGNLQKISAVGVRITRGVTMHGCALNVTVELEPFTKIIPCGIVGCEVTSMAQVLGREVDISIVRKQMAKQFADVFNLEWVDRQTELPAISQKHGLNQSL